MDDFALDRLFSGDCNKLIALPKRVVRLFISSTFTDMTLERNTLMERIYPRLKKYCREKHGLDFQVVDMRWGVRDEATDDHQTVSLCSREIDNCQRLSLGPNFVALIGDKYGFRPLPNRIKSTEYRATRRCLIELDINTDFLDTWYKEDLNSVPAEYLLQPISSILKNFTNKSEPELQSVDQKIWSAIQDRLHDLLMIGSSRLVKQGRMTESERLMKYSISVTEREVIEGCLDVKDAKSHCLVYIRSIVDLKQQLADCLLALEEQANIQAQGATLEASQESSASMRRRSSGSPTGETKRKASLKIGEDSISLETSGTQSAIGRRLEKSRRLMGKYIDLRSKDSKWQLDHEAQDALGELKVNKLFDKLGQHKKNLTVYEIHWNEQDGMSMKSEEHKVYLNQLTEHFYTNLTRMIRKAAKQDEQNIIKSGLIGEVLQHSHYAIHASKTFHGRRQELEKIRNYISGHSNGYGNPPLFIYGVDGSGKSSILAKTAILAKSWVASSKKSKPSSYGTTSTVDQMSCIIMRFCCTTPSSSSMVGVLTSVCHQLQYNFYQFGAFNGMVNKRTNGSSNEDNEGSQLPFEKIPEDFVRLVFTFRRLLDNCRHELHIRRKFVIILDSIDRLTSAADNNMEVKYSWLTSIVRLPPNVRLLVSCSSEPNSSSLEDFLFLKRHFLELSYRQSRLEDSRLWTISTSSERESLATGSLNSSGGHQVIDDPKLSLNAIRDKYALIRRVIVPAVRLMRSSKDFSANMTMRTRPESRASYSSSTFTDGKARISPTVTPSSPHPDPAIEPQASERRLNFVESCQRHNLKSTGTCWILHVKPMGVQLALSVLQRWLSSNGRTLTEQQWKITSNSFAYCSRPIFVKLAFGEVLNWKSYSTQSDAKGLTFGSVLLMSNSELEASETGEELRRSIEHLSDRVEKSKEDEELLMQMLIMEQQWLNYLDFKQNDYTDSSNDKTTDKSDPNSQNTLVLRVRQNNGPSGGSAKSLGSSICHLSNTISDAICQLFARIELQHGFILTKHSLSYITAARNGICENELEDILSLDDVVLDDVFQYHLPPVRRIPPLLWTRIRSDLPDYLSERDADGMIVVNWHHNQFKAVTLSRYLGDTKQRLYVHSTMADYFLGKWADKAKPFRCTKQQVQMAAEQLESAVQQSLRDSQCATGTQRPSISSGGRLIYGSTSVRSGTSFSVRNRLRSSGQHDRLQWMQAKADRRVPHQPLYYSDRSDVTTNRDDTNSRSSSEIINQSDEQLHFLEEKQSRRFNMRKLTELPYHLMRSLRYSDLATHVLFSYKWLAVALDSIGLQALLSDFEEARRSIQMTLSRLSEENDVIQTNSRTRLELGQLLEGEMDIIIDQKLNIESLKSMIKQIDILSSTLRLSSSCLHSDTQMLASQLLGRLLPLVRHSRSRKQMNSSQNQENYLDQLLDQCDLDGSVDCGLLPMDHCLQSPDGLELSSLEGHSFAVMSMVVAVNQRHLLAASNKFIMWDITTGEIARDIEVNMEGSIMMGLRIGLNNQYAVSYTTDNQVIVLAILTQQVVKFDLKLKEPVVGLNLIDRLGAMRFLVWTSTRWLTLKIVDGEDSETSMDSMAKRFSVIIESQFDRSDLNLFSRILSVDQLTRGSDDLTFVISIQPTESGEDILILSSLRIQNSTSEIMEVWPEYFPAISTMAISLTLSQVVFCDFIGNIYLSRRRRCGWSRPKCISIGRQSQKDLDDLSAISELNRIDASRRKYGLPLAIDLQCHSERNSRDELSKLVELDHSERLNLSDLESQVDGLHLDDEIQATRVFSNIIGQEDFRSHTKDFCCPLKLVGLYFSDRITLIDLLVPIDSDKRERNFKFPREVRNVCVEVNKSQVLSKVIGNPKSIEDSFLVVAAGKRLMFYSINNETLVKSIDAHAGRILQLAPITTSSDIANDESYCVASASMDKTVKIWNLSNLNKDSYALDLLGGPIESMSIASQRPLAACLTRDLLAIYDWRTLRRVACVQASDLTQQVDGHRSGQLTQTRSSGSIRMTNCKFSLNSRYLCIATDDSRLHLFSVDNPKSSSGVLKSRMSDIPNLRQVNLITLPTPGRLRKLVFFSQDSRLLVMIDCKIEPNSKRDSQISELTANTELTQTTASEHLLHRILVLCYSIPDARLVFKINCLTPAIAAKSESQLIYGKRLISSQGYEPVRGSTGRVPVLTKDQLHIVAVEFSMQTSEQELQSALSDSRRSSAMTRLPIDLSLYSTRDGCLIRRIDLNRLDQFELQPGVVGSKRHSSGNLDASLPQINSNQLASYSSATKTTATTDFQQKPPVETKFVSIYGDQFTKVKSINYMDRQSVVVLIHKDTGFSYFIDVNSRQLLLSSTIWGGKVSSDGRHGLSKIFKSATLRPMANSYRNGFDQFGSSTGSGLQLLEMRHCRPVKTLISSSLMSKLYGQELETTGNDSDLRCGFTRPNNDYIYCYNNRLKRMMLIRSRDNQLIANYKLSNSVKKIKCSHDGYSLILANIDGSMTSLAIVDPQESYTQTRLAQLPSRQRG